MKLLLGVTLRWIRISLKGKLEVGAAPMGHYVRMSILSFSSSYVFPTTVVPRALDESSAAGNAPGNGSEAITSKFDY